ncbi:hypothetical protein AUTU_15330 [Aureibacter tunicatorum]|nr:hypothetical protein AUTU_15330 [Aureibacter tunicatorum]
MVGDYYVNSQGVLARSFEFVQGERELKINGIQKVDYGMVQYVFVWID